MADTLAGLAGQLEARVKALRGGGDDAALLAAARDAAWLRVRARFERGVDPQHTGS